jgi:VCBS repeat-containing protein
LSELIGRQIDHYRIDTLLGEGGMGVVYQAYDLNLALPVALKIMHTQLAKQATFKQRFMQEAQAAAHLRHPSIVNVKYFGDAQGLLFMVMDLITGPGLGAYLHKQENSGQMILLSETLYIIAQVADALDYAHRQGVVHRDVKPDNVLIQPVDRPDRDNEPALRAVVTDFGLAKLLQGGVETSTGSFLGTMPYMSPEQCMGVQLDGRSDIYSLGIMLYQLATGRLPFTIKTPAEAAEKHIRGIPPNPRSIQPGLPESIEAIIQTAISKNPDHRYQQAAILAADLRRAALNLTEADTTYLSPQTTVVSLVTQLKNYSDFQEPSRMEFNPDTMYAGDQLLVAHKDHTPRTINLSKKRYVLGRSEDNDIVLPEDGVSRKHARLEHINRGWQIVDLGSTNGTYLEGQKLLPDVPEDWTSNQTVRVGPFFLNWKHGDQLNIRPGETLQASGLPRVTLVDSVAGQLSVTVNPPELTIDPGKEDEVQVELLRLGNTVDHYRISVEGLPEGWVTVPSEPLQLMPGARSNQKIKIHPPQHSSALSGQRQINIVVQSTSNAHENLAVPMQLTFKPFEKFSADLQPSQIQSGGTSQVTIHNTGNTEGIYSIVGRDPANALQFKGLRGRVKVPPGEMKKLNLVVIARNRPMMGGQSQLPFEIQVHASDKDHQSFPGELAVKPVFPWWLLFAIGLLVLVCLSGTALAAGSYFFRPEPPVLANGRTETPADLPGGGLPIKTPTDTHQDDTGSTGAGIGEPDLIGTQTPTKTPILTLTPTWISTVTPEPSSTPGAPVARDSSIQVSEDAPAIIDIAQNVADPEENLDWDSLSVTSPPVHGVVAVQESGTFEYISNLDYNGSDNFGYTVCDLDNLCDTATITLEVLPVNDPPVAKDVLNNVNEDKTLNVGAPGVLKGDMDIDGDRLVASLESKPGFGNISLDSDGSFTYTPNPNYCGTDTFRYKVSDGNGGEDTGEVNVQVNCINDKPVGNKDTYQNANEDIVFKVNAPGVLANDEDVDKDKLTAKRVKNTQYGDVKVNANGSFTYTPDLDFCSSAGRVDVFEYEVSDGEKTDRAEANIIVRCDTDEKIQYRITVKTGDKSDAGTDAAVYIRLFGTQEVTPQVGFQLATPNVDDHERNKTYKYTITTNDGIGHLKYAEIWLANGSNKNTDGWFMEYVQITRLDNGETEKFTCNQWFDADSNGNITRRKLVNGGCQ